MITNNRLLVGPLLLMLLLLFLSIIVGPVAANTAEQEPNDDFDTAQQITEDTLIGTVDNGESDFYAIEANTTDALDIEITDRDSSADLDLVLYRPDRTELARDGRFDNRDLTLKAPETGTYFIEVDGGGQEVTSDYRLNVTKITPSENDAFAANDGFESAATIPEGFSDATIWGGESDFYKIDANTTDALDIAITQRDSGADLNLVLYAPDRTELVRDGRFDNRDITLKAPETGTYFIEVEGGSQEVTSEYTLSVDKITPSENDAFAPNDGFESAATVPERFNDATIWGGESDFYKIDANTTDALDIAITQRDSGADLNLVLYSSNRTELARDGRFDNRDLTLKAPETDTYFIEVKGGGQEITTDYRLDVNKITPSENDAFAPNDDFDSAAVLSDQFTDATIWGGESDFYRVGLNKSERIDLEIIRRDGNLDLVLYAPNQTELARDGRFDNRAITQTAPEQGTYFVEIAGSGLETTSEYQLRSNKTGLLPTESPGDVQLTATGVDSIQPGTTFTQTYAIQNIGSDTRAFTIQAMSGTSNATVNSFTGDIEVTNVTGDPPSASTESISAGANGSVTVEYSVVDNATGSVIINTTVLDPLSGSSETVSQEISIQQGPPEDPTERVLQITGRGDPSELTQNDVTAAITRFNRGQSINSIQITQNDITAVITLFERS